jgi:hypothetical protein
MRLQTRAPAAEGEAASGPMIDGAPMPALGRPAAPGAILEESPLRCHPVPERFTRKRIGSR